MGEINQFIINTLLELISSLWLKIPEELEICTHPFFKRRRKQ